MCRKLRRAPLGIMAETADIRRSPLLSGCTVSPLRCFTSHPCGSSPTPYPPIWPEQRRRCTALLALVAPQRSGSFQDGFWAMAILCMVALPVIWTLPRAVSARTR
jgi:hypothetical protein